MITLAESSMGARAYAEVDHSGMGMDWEHGQYRINAIKPICSRGKAKNDIMEPRAEKIENRNYYFCSACGGGERVSRSDRYCKWCGQRLK